MRIVFMGTPDFAVPSLEILVQNGYEVVAVITAPDKPAGRGLKLQPSAVKVAAERLGLPILQPEKLKNEDFLNQLRALKADLQIVVAFRMLPEVVWAMPPLGTINLHASLLPQYRGAAPINWAIINGETETGATTFFLRHEIDTGDLIMQVKEPIYRSDTAGTLYERLMHNGAKLVLQTVQAIEKGNVTATPQQQIAIEELKKAPKIFKETCEINFHQSAEEVFNFVRGMNPFPTAWTRRKGLVYKIYKVDPIHNGNNYQPGEWHTDGKTFLHIGTSDGYIAVEELQTEGKKRMSIAEFLRGNKI
ncbi:methionyl-tRNA formyltransferase [Rhodoflexus sp.]